MDREIIRRASFEDVDELVAMRRDFTFEDEGSQGRASRPEYEIECREFLIEAISSGRWDIWVAEAGGQIVSHAYVALVDKVPRPVRENRRIGYMTNVYTRPSHRASGIGGRLVERAQEAARESDVELMIVWPSAESITFYKRHGFKEAVSDEPLIWESDRPIPPE
jgi:N-acetylglutamate synthase-like GNAT family acetyltransferase